MKTFALRNDAAATPDLGLRHADDNGGRTLKVWKQKSVEWLATEASSRKLFSAITRSRDGGFLITIGCNKEQLEEIRAEFNRRPLR